jgi:hypothetical protein
MSSNILISTPPEWQGLALILTLPFFEEINKPSEIMRAS